MTKELLANSLNSGRKVYRTYYMSIGSRIRQAVENLYGDADFQRTAFPLMETTGDSVAAVRYRGEYEKEICLENLSGGDKEQLLEAYQKEFAAMTISRLEKEAPIGLIRFTSTVDEEAIRWQQRQEAMDYRDYSEYRYYGRRDNLATSGFYPVYPSFTETIRLLNSHGVKTGGYLDGLDVRSVQVYWNYWQDREDGGSYNISQNFFVEDPKQVEELKQILVSDRLCYYNPFFKKEDLDVNLMVQNVPEDIQDPEELEWKEEWESNISVSFPKGMVPEYVKSRMKE